jgi:hypothetical protein
MMTDTASGRPTGRDDDRYDDRYDARNTTTEEQEGYA